MLAHREIHRYAEAHRLSDVPRTTVVCCLVQQGQIHWAHAGDSRLYLVRKGRLLTRTRDHSKIENLLQQNAYCPWKWPTILNATSSTTAWARPTCR